MSSDYSASRHSITMAVRNWKRGDEVAGYELDRLRADLLARLRGIRDKRFGARIDSEVVANKAFMTLLVGIRAGDFPNLSNRDRVKALLFEIARGMLFDEYRRESAQKRGDRDRRDYSELDHIADKSQLSPEDCAMAMEYWRKLPEVVREVHSNSIDILEKVLEGFSTNQIAMELGMGTRNVQKIKQDMEVALNKWLAGEEQHGSAAPESGD